MDIVILWLCGMGSNHWDMPVSPYNDSSVFSDHHMMCSAVQYTGVGLSSYCYLYKQAWCILVCSTIVNIISYSIILGGGGGGGSIVNHLFYNIYVVVSLCSDQMLQLPCSVHHCWITSTII